MELHEFGSFLESAYVVEKGNDKQSDGIRHLLDRFRAGEVSRRTFLTRTSAFGISGAAANLLMMNVSAQDASPAATPSASPAGIGEKITSITRAEYFEQLDAHFEFEKPDTMGGTFVHTYTTDISTLNPIIASDVYSQMIAGWIFEGLVGESLIDGTIVPSGLADYWEIAPDGVTYTIHLNPAARWHDGESVAADDVVFTLDAVVAENSPSIRTSIVTEALASYREIDDHTVELVSKQQSALFLNNTVNQFAIMPKHIWADVPLGEMASDPGSTGQDPSRVIGSGPFLFKEWVLGSQLSLVSNTEYWDPDRVPHIDTYIFNVVEDANTQVASLQAGETDFAAIEKSQVESLRESNPEFQFAEYETGSMSFYFFNLDPEQSEIFTDVNVRRALHYALDKDLYVDSVLNGYGVRANGPQPPISPAWAPDRMRERYDFDVDKARSLLDDAGWTLGDSGVREKDGTPLKFEMTFSSSEDMYRNAVTFIQQYWREVGVEVVPKPIPFPTQLEQLDAHNFESAFIEFVWGPSGFQGAMFYCDSLPPNGFNWMKYCNERYDELDHEAMGELNEDRRIDLMIEAANIINDELPIGIFAFKQGVSAAVPRVHNFFPNSYSGSWWIQYTWMDAE